MSKLPLLSGRECMVVFQRAGFEVKRQRGSHIIMKRDSPYGKVVVPNLKEVPRGTLRAMIREAGLTIEEFLALLNE